MCTNPSSLYSSGLGVFRPKYRTYYCYYCGTKNISKINKCKTCRLYACLIRDKHNYGDLTEKESKMCLHCYRKEHDINDPKRERYAWGCRIL